MVVDREQVMKKVQEALADSDLLEATEVSSVNFKPHPYMITPKHLERNDSMYLGQEQIERMEREHGPMCGMQGCKLRYWEHTSDTALFLHLKRDCKKDEAQTAFKALATVVDGMGIDGFALVETPEKYRIEGVGE